MDLRSIDLNLLLALDALLDERNVTRAAMRLSIGQSAMSAALGRLRKHFNDQLLVRDGQLLEPTPLAEGLQSRVREAVRAAQDVFNRSRMFDPHADRRTFRILASDYTTLVLLRAVSDKIAGEAPLQALKIDAVDGDYIATVRSGDADFAIMPAELVHHRARFAYRHLFADRLVVVADKHNDAVQAGLSAQDFAALPYIAFDSGTHGSLPDSRLDALEIERRIEMTVPTLALIPLLVQGSQKVALTYERLALYFSEHFHIKMVEPSFPLRPVSETLYWHPAQSDDPAHSWLRQRIIDCATMMD